MPISMPQAPNKDDLDATYVALAAQTSPGKDVQRRRAVKADIARVR